MWVKAQLKNSNYLNRLNSLYKNQTVLESEESPSRQSDFVPDQGVNLILAGVTDKQRAH
jgi:hypothetical protein